MKHVVLYVLGIAARPRSTATGCVGAWSGLLAVLLLSGTWHPCHAASRRQCRIACTEEIASCRDQAWSRRERHRCKRTWMRACLVSGVQVCDTTTTTTLPTVTTTTIPASASCGGFITAWGSSGSANGEFQFPGGVATDGSANVYVADTGNNRIQKFDTRGTFLTAWGTAGSGNAQFQHPVGIAAGGGYVYVADAGNNRIQMFDAFGSFLTAWGGWGFANGQFNGPAGVAYSLIPMGYETLYVAETGNTRIQKFELPGGAAGGIFVNSWASAGSGSLSQPEGMATDASGNLYVADTGNGRVDKFDPFGTFLTAWGGLGSGNGQFNNPQDVATDADGNVYVSDTGNNRIEKFDGSGAFIAAWGTAGSGNGQFNVPTGVATDGSRYVYVTDAGNARIQKFTCPLNQPTVSTTTTTSVPTTAPPTTATSTTRVTATTTSSTTTITVTTSTLACYGSYQCGGSCPAPYVCAYNGYWCQCSTPTTTLPPCGSPDDPQCGGACGKDCVGGTCYDGVCYFAASSNNCACAFLKPCGDEPYPDQCQFGTCLSGYSCYSTIQGYCACL